MQCCFVAQSTAAQVYTIGWIYRLLTFRKARKKQNLADKHRCCNVAVTIHWVNFHAAFKCANKEYGKWSDKTKKGRKKTSVLRYAKTNGKISKWITDLNIHFCSIRFFCVDLRYFFFLLNICFSFYSFIYAEIILTMHTLTHTHTRHAFYLMFSSFVFNWFHVCLAKLFWLHRLSSSSSSSSKCFAVVRWLVFPSSRWMRVCMCVFLLCFVLCCLVFLMLCLLSLSISIDGEAYTTHCFST